MGQMQTCWVCGRSGLLVEEQIQVSPAGGGPTMLGQCPRCHRFICSQHGELLDLSGKRGWFRKPQSLTLCCPFDPGVPLGPR